MRSIRAQLFFVTVASMGCAVYFGLQVHKHFEDVTRWERQNAEQVALQNQLLMVRESPEFRTDVFTYLQAMRSRLPATEIRDQFSNVVQAYSSRNYAELLKRANLFHEESRGLIAQNNQYIEYSRSKLLKMIQLALAVPLIGLGIAVLIVYSKVFYPLHRLSNRMFDFLEDRFAFQFSEPEDNEIGALQGNFNSLAQRVINNMEELKRLDMAKSEFLNIASHELRTPMTSIKGSLSLLASGKVGSADQQAMRLITVAETEADRLIRLINDLLDFAKIEAGKMPLKCVWMDWKQLVDKTIESLQGLCQRAGVTIESQSPNDLQVYIDPDRIQQVLTNLISNAVKFSPQGGVVTLGVIVSTGKIHIDVRDQGPGIPQEDQSLIFQKFRQGAGPKNPLVKGTGLGLTISKAIVEQHGGTIGVESKVNQGSTFYFTILQFKLPDTATVKRAS